MRMFWTAFAAAVLALLPASAAQAQFFGIEKSEVKEGYQLKPGATKILVFRPSVHVGEQTIGGLNEPSVEWTEAAKKNIMAAMEAEHAARGSQLVMVTDEDEDGEMGRLIADYSALFSTVANSALNHKMLSGNRLPTKRDRFDWTLGEDASRLKALGGDYGLFFYTYDSYGSTGRKIFQALALVLGGGFAPAGVHVGYAGLVDLDTGELVWLMVDTLIGGDVRTEEGAKKRVTKLMRDFPIRAEGVAVPEGTVIFDPPLPPESEPADETSTGEGQ